MIDYNRLSSPLYPDDASVGEVTYPPGGTLGPRTQLNIQLVFLHRGTIRVWVDEHLISAKPGTAMLLLPNHQEYFEFTPDGETEHSWLHFYTTDAPPELLDHLRHLPKIINLSAEMTTLITRALRLQSSNLSTATMLLKALAQQMIWLYIGESEQADQHLSQQQNATIERALAYIQAHLSDDIRLGDIAADVSVSENHLIRLFKQHVGTTPIDYLWTRRIGHAVDLLQRTGLSVGQIAAASGFKTSYHFSRRISQETGLTPTEMRKKECR